MYTPPSAIKSSTIEIPQIRLFLVGIPKSGKTFTTLTTFPNPTLADFDKGLTTKELTKRDIPVCEFHNPEWLAKHYAGKNSINAFSDFMFKEAMKMTSDQTLVVDSLSTLADALREHLDKITPVSPKTGEKDGFWFWKQWSIWLQQFCMRLTTLKCHVVLTAHEQEVRDQENGKFMNYRWLLQGQEFSHRLPQFFTDVFRQTRTTTETIKPGPITVVESKYEWQIAPDTKFPYCCTRMNSNQKFVPATFASFKY